MAWPDRLAALIGRGNRQPTRALPIEEFLAQTFGWTQGAPWGRLCGAASGTAKLNTNLDARDATGTWLMVEPVMLVAGMNTLSMQRTATGAVSPTLIDALRPVFADYGATLTHWHDLLLAHFDTRLDLHALPLSACLDRELRDCLPTGADAGRIRRLMTECQMTLHAAQDAFGGSANPLTGQVNGIWLHGDNAVTCDKPGVTPVLFSDRPLLQALGGTGLPQNADDWQRALTDAAERHRPVVWEGPVDHPLLPALLLHAREQLWRGRIADLNLGLWPQDGGAGNQWQVRRRDLPCFWRRPAALAALLTPPSDHD